MKLKLFTLFALAAVIIASSGTAFAQGPLPPTVKDAWSLPKQAIPALQAMDNPDSRNFKSGAALATAGDAIRDGGFEKGLGFDWGEYSTHGFPLVTSAADLPLPPHDGTHAVWLGGAENETSYVIQYGVPIHKPATVLHLWYVLASQETVCGSDLATINIWSDKVFTWDLCDAHDSTDWTELTVDLSAYDGMDMPLSFAVATNGSLNSNLFIDDVSITGGSFADVPPSNPYYGDIEILYANGMTAGCNVSPLKFCLDQLMDRAQSAVFMMRGNLGSSYVPQTNFDYKFFNEDWTKGTWARPWAEDMLNKSLTAGCSLSPVKFCPWDLLPREQVIIFGLRLKYGNGYLPPAATGTVLADMTDPNYYATAWAEQGYKDGLLPKCGMSGEVPLFCPRDTVTRGLAASMIVKAKNLTMP